MSQHGPRALWSLPTSFSAKLSPSQINAPGTAWHQQLTTGIPIILLRKWFIIIIVNIPDNLTTIWVCLKTWYGNSVGGNTVVKCCKSSPIIKYDKNMGGISQNMGGFWTYRNFKAVTGHIKAGTRSSPLGCAKVSRWKRLGTAVPPGLKMSGRFQTAWWLWKKWDQLSLNPNQLSYMWFPENWAHNSSFNQ